MVAEMDRHGGGLHYDHTRMERLAKRNFSLDTIGLCDAGISKKRNLFKLYSHVKEIVLNAPEYLGLRLYVVNENIVAQKTYSRCGMDGGHYKLYEWIK